MIGLATLLTLAAASPPPPAVEREIEAPAGARVAVALDRDVYDVARPDLGDLRVVSADGSPVPFLLERGLTANAWERSAPRILNRGYVRGQSETATLDFGGRSWKSDLSLSLAGENFRRRVVVEASEDAVSWTTVVDDAYVFAVPGPSPARFEQVPLPENDARFLRLTIHHGDGDSERLEIRGVTARTASRRAPQAMPISTRLARHEDPDRHETLVTLDLGARNIPFQRIDVDVANGRFLRGVLLEGRRDPRPPRPGESPQPVSWIPLGEGCLYRYDEKGRRSEALSLAVSGRERAIRLRIRNRDDRPLEIRGVTVLAPVERLLFEPVEGRRYRLTYGSPHLPAPSYDLSRTVEDVGAWAASASPGRLGEPVRRGVAAARVAWTERHPVLLWAGLLVVVTGLGALTWRAMRTSG